MAQKIYISGNYVVKENTAGFFTLVDNKNNVEFKIALSDSINWANAADGLVAYTGATLRTFFLNNTGL